MCCVGIWLEMPVYGIRQQPGPVGDEANAHYQVMSPHANGCNDEAFRCGNGELIFVAAARDVRMAKAGGPVVTGGKYEHRGAAGPVGTEEELGHRSDGGTAMLANPTIAPSDSPDAGPPVQADSEDEGPGDIVLDPLVNKTKDLEFIPKLDWRHRPWHAASAGPWAVPYADRRRSKEEEDVGHIGSYDHFISHNSRIQGGTFA